MRPITPSNNNGLIRLRWTHQGKRYSLSFGDWHSSPDRADALALAARILADIRARTFDESLTRYKHTDPDDDGDQRTTLTALEAFNLWSLQANHSDSTKHHTDKHVRLILSGRKELANISTTTFNRRLGTIQQALRWAAQQGFEVTNDVWSELSKQKQVTKPIRPFSHSELKRLVEAVETVNPHYVPFIKFLIISGCRFGEAAGLFPDMVNRDTNEITIARTYSNADAGSNYTLKQRTKTNTIRILKSPQLIQLIPIGSIASAPCFTQMRGGLIHHGNFIASVWKPALIEADLEYRKLHTLRHTALSLALEAGLTVPQVAAIAGHKDSTMVVKTYGHMITRPEVPVMDI